ncbi:MAG TPA: HNH endonuclease [Edaphocola sp.]|nr:HNH endonuclease [Edaphocola sp.]
MSKITIEKVAELFATAVKFHNKEITLKEATTYLETKGINSNSSVDYLYNYTNMISGKLFTRTMNVISTKYYLDKILEFNGIDSLKKALNSLSLHIDYYESVSNSKVKRRKEILNKYLKEYSINPDDFFGEQVENDKNLYEGAVKTVKMNIYERNPIVRQMCIEFHSAICKVCDFDFEKKFGEIGKGFIHVHHLKEISDIKKEYEINYKNDLIPVCPNCHAMLHKRKPAFTVEELKAIINQHKK